MCHSGTGGHCARRLKIRPENSRLQFRIGIHVGDVMLRGGDLLGDGVNIAARLESLAEPGGVCISGTAHAFVRKVLPLVYNDLGPHFVKNIEEPVQVYHVTNPTLAEHEQRSGKRAISSNSGRMTIAVMPFANLSGDPAQLYFSDGITEDIITDLSRFHELVVRASSSSFGWRDRNVDGRQLRRELGVHYIVEGSVRRLGDRLRITVQLIDAISGDHLWSERFDRSQQDIFAVQDEIVRTIVASLVGRLQAAGSERAKRKLPANLTAYECVLRGRSLPVVEPEGEAEARRLYERAIELDPGYAQAHALLAYMLTLEWWWDMSLSQSLLDRALELAKKAVALDQHERLCHKSWAMFTCTRKRLTSPSSTSCERSNSTRVTRSRSPVWASSTRSWDGRTRALRGLNKPSGWTRIMIRHGGGTCSAWRTLWRIGTTRPSQRSAARHQRQFGCKSIKLHAVRS